jgi:hypothetical protein
MKKKQPELKILKLYEVPRHSRVRVIGKDGKPSEDIINFDYVDGMYSLCFDPTGHPIHLAAWTEVEVVK